jgi:histidyl-tRNA synthetase
VEGVRALLGAGRKDESGDFTKGANLSLAAINILMQFVEAKPNIEQELALGAIRFEQIGNSEASEIFKGSLVSSKLNAISGQISRKSASLKNLYTCGYLGRLCEGSNVGTEGVSELIEIAFGLGQLGYGPDRIIIDPSVVRGLGYYTGPVFEAELTFEIPDDKGRPRQFGSVAGGGRYDDLVKRFTGQSVPATGVSIGVDRLLAALRAKGRLGGQHPGPVVVTVMDRDRMGDYFAMAAELQRAGIRAEVYLGNPKNFGNQLKYADNRQSPVAVIQGGDELARDVVILKDLALGARIAANATLEEWKSRPAQIEVPRAELVAAVRRMLAQ